MKIVFAPDKFKGTLSAQEVCDILHRAFHNVIPDAEYVSCPMSDGGEGFMETMARNCGGVKYQAKVFNAQMQEVTASYLILSDGETAILDSASASGSVQIPEGKTDQLTATSYGTGQLIASAISHGARKIIAGLGGSVCTDGGTGMVQALGFTFHDGDGKILEPGKTRLARIETIDSTSVNPELANVDFIAATDVNNPLTGNNGTAAIYAPQKGASTTDICILEESLNHLKEVWAKSGMWSTPEEPGFGAAGGLGAAMKVYLHADISSGADILLRMTNFQDVASDADYIITGEGRTDNQTGFGKVCLKVADAVKNVETQVILLSGAITADETFLAQHFDASFSTLRVLMSERQVLALAEDDLFFTATQIAKLIHGRKRLS